MQGMRKVVARLLFAATAAVLALAGGAALAAGDRFALVIGNAAYRPPLANPVNDAQATAELLRNAGFEVDLRTDADLATMRAAIARFGAEIRRPEVKFAVFYYAGHGMQLDWRNYIIPVSARIRTAEDVPQQATEITELVNYMSQAKGRNYVVILDACRDDPFAGAYRPPNKGLSQFNAPAGSVLAYATAPGMVASDGDGRNGLYTSHLLREFAVRGAKLEDAFKRTRVNVRLASGGRQIPWETTSLEEDLYLFPPAKLKFSDRERDEMLEDELASWARVNPKDVNQVAAFIQRFPSGNLSEVATARLNRLLADQLRREVEQRVQAEREAQLKQAAEAAERLALEAARKAREDQERAEAARREALRLAAESERRAREQQARRDAEAARLQAEAARLEAERQAAEREQVRLAEAARAAKEAQDRLEAQARAERERLAQAQAEAAAAAAAPPPAPHMVAVAELPSTPFFAGGVENFRRYAVGDEFRIRVLDRYTSLERPPLDLRVTKVDSSADRVEFNNGEYVSDLLGNVLTNLVGSSSTPRQLYPAEFVVGKRWTTRFRQVRPNGVAYTFAYELKVVGRERITVPAGTFDTYKIEARGFNVELAARIERNIWVAPGINADIAHEILVKLRSGVVEQNDRQELVSFRQAAAYASR